LEGLAQLIDDVADLPFEPNQLGPVSAERSIPPGLGSNDVGVGSPNVDLSASPIFGASQNVGEVLLSVRAAAPWTTARMVPLFERTANDRATFAEQRVDHTLAALFEAAQGLPETRRIAEHERMVPEVADFFKLNLGGQKLTHPRPLGNMKSGRAP